ncbi:MAG: superoxide dismutase [Gemmatimonadota bacterium]
MTRPPAARPTAAHAHRSLRRVGLATAAFATVALAACNDRSPTGLAVSGIPTAARAAAQFPDRIPLPNGFLPEGVASGPGSTFYAGSRRDGAIYSGDLRTGEGALLVAGEPGGFAVGLEYDQQRDRLWVAGGATGTVSVYDASTGERLARFQLTAPSPETFLNDLVVTRDAVYVTDSRDDVLYRIPLGPGGALPEPGAVEALSLGGDYRQLAGLNANGIEASPNGKTLLVINSANGTLYRVDAATGVAAVVDLGGATLTNGDGLLLVGRTLYVVQNRLNQIAVVQLGPDYATGAVGPAITSPAFDVPTTVAAFGGSLYAVNARFTTPPTPATSYDVVRVDR